MTGCLGLTQLWPKGCLPWVLCRSQICWFSAFGSRKRHDPLLTPGGSCSLHSRQNWGVRSGHTMENPGNTIAHFPPRYFLLPICALNPPGIIRAHTASAPTLQIQRLGGWKRLAAQVGGDPLSVNFTNALGGKKGGRKRACNAQQR